MAVSPDTEPFIEREWDAAVAASGADPDNLYLLPVSGTPVANMPEAVTYWPGLRSEEDDFLLGEKLAEANSPGVRERHRIAIFEDVDEGDPLAVAILAGKLRHELRHAEQWEACGEVLFELDALLDSVVLWKVGGLTGGALYYTVKPIEMDANAAAAVFLRNRWGQLVDDVLRDPDGSALAKSNTAPGALENLPAKTVAFLFCLREAADEWAAAEGTSIEELLGLHSFGARQLWDGLCGGW